MSETWGPLILAVVDAWAAMTAERKAALIVAEPELYGAISRLARHGRFTLHLD